MLKLYEYKNCSTCKKAIKFLKEHGVAFEAIPIVDTPPSEQEILKMIKFQEGNIKKVFNTSGQLYREMGIKDKINDMGPKESAALLAKNGKLVKRPFLLDKNFGLVGFKEDLWTEALEL